MTRARRNTFFVLAAILVCMTAHPNLLYKNADAEGMGHPADNASVFWTLREYEDRIALFENDAKKPVEVFDVWIAYLPEQDKEQLRSGIHADKPSELLKMIEDYTS